MVKVNFAFCFSPLSWLPSFLCFRLKPDPPVLRSERQKPLPHFLSLDPSPQRSDDRGLVILYMTSKTARSSANTAGSGQTKGLGRKTSASSPDRTELSWDLHYSMTPVWDSISHPRGELELSCLLRNSLGATSLSSRATTLRLFFATHRTAMVSSTLAKDTRPSTVLLPRRGSSVIIFETLLAKTVHEVSLLHLERM